MDLTPRTTPAVDGPGGSVAPRSGGRRLRNAALLTVVLAALGFVAFRGLGNATLFFYNVDEAVERRLDIGDDRFRLQGAVADGFLTRDGSTAAFTVSYNGVSAEVHHRGEIPKMFAAGIPVVLEGRWRDGVFASDRMLVKHSEVYVAQNPERVETYDDTSGETPTP
jgi:cytochrome c-type biogenesis protein CcmE